MAGRILNRRDLRRQAELAEQRGPVTPETTPAASRGTTKRKPRAKKGPPRVCARWGIFDGSMKLLASFDYNQRAEAERKLAEFNEKKSGTFFLQIVKEAMPGMDDNLD
jgi:hypothetical protein